MRLAPVIAFAILVAGCNTTTVQTPTRSLDRPADVALLCVSWGTLPSDPPGTPPHVLMLPITDPDGRPACDVPDPNALGAPPNPNAVISLANGTQVTPNLLVLSSNTGRGELALATTPPFPCNTSGTVITNPGGTMTTLNGTTVCAPGQSCDTNTNLCVAQMGTGYSVESAQIVDLDRLTPGFGFIPLGLLPEHMRATDDGCRAVSANVNGCDLSVVDLARMMAVEVADEPQPEYLSVLARRVQPSIKGVPLGASPTWIEISPTTTDYGLVDDGVVRAATTATCAAADASGPFARRYRAMVAFPSCELVAEVDLTTGELTQAMKVTRAGAVPVADLSTIHCPNDCAGSISSAPIADAAIAFDLATPADLSVPKDFAVARDLGATKDAGGLVDAGNPHDASTSPRLAGDGGNAPLVPQTQAWPSSLAFAVDTTEMPAVACVTDGDCAAAIPGADSPHCDHTTKLCRVPARKQLVISDAATDRITFVPLGGHDRFGTPTSTTLSDAPGGVEVIRVSPRVSFGAGHDVRYLYAAARDHSVRVIDLDTGMECETNPDPLVIDQRFPIADASGNLVAQPLDVAFALRCLPVGDPMTPRIPTALNAGIPLPGGALPKSFAFTHAIPPVPVNPGPGATATPGLIVGDTAWIFDSSGHATAVNLVDQCPQPNILIDPSQLQACDPGNFAPSVKTAIGYQGMPLPRAMDLMPNRIRASNPRFQQPAGPADIAGGPRLSEFPLVSLVGISTPPILTANVDPTVPSLCNVPVAGMSAVGGVTAGVCQALPVDVSTTNFVAFPDPITARSENWSLSWEGLLTAGLRSSGEITGAALSDVEGAFCARDVEPGDKLYIIGCTDDTVCAPDQQCYIDPGSVDQTHGMCFKRSLGNLDPTVLAQATAPCVAWTQGTRRWRITSVDPSNLTLDELPEPEHPIDTHDCRVDADCADVKIAAPGSFTPVPDLPTQCLDSEPGRKTCLRACSTANPLCGVGYICASSSRGGQRCLRAQLPDPNLVSLCFAGPQLYELHAGESFYVHADTTVLAQPEGIDPATGKCVIPPTTNSLLGLLSPRVPIEPPFECNLPDPTTWFTAPLPPTVPVGVNSCRLVPTGDDGARRYIRYQNQALVTVLQIPITVLSTFGTSVGGADAGVQNPDGGHSEVDGGMVNLSGVAHTKVPADFTSFLFTVVGGFTPLTTPLGTDVLAQQPRASQVAPDRVTIYVDDEGREALATGLQGQIIRFLSQSQISDSLFLVR